MLTITSNEHPKRIAEVRAAIRDSEVTKKPLPAGDVWFDAHGKLVIVEMKWSLSDLLASFQVKGEDSGPRLAVEVRKMIELADIPILLVPTLHRRADGGIEGAYSDWQYASAKGILCDVQLFGVIVDEWDGYMVDRLAQWYLTLRKTEHNWIRNRGRPTFVPIDTVYPRDIWALCAYEDVGPEVAKALLWEFGSVEDVLRAAREGPERLQKVKTGEKPRRLSRRVVDSLHEAATRRWG